MYIYSPLSLSPCLVLFSAYFYLLRVSVCLPVCLSDSRISHSPSSSTAPIIDSKGGVIINIICVLSTDIHHLSTAMEITTSSMIKSPTRDLVST